MANWADYLGFIGYNIAGEVSLIQGCF